ATPMAALSGWGWATCTTDRAGGFYAVPYYFAKKIQADVGVPVGLVCSKWSGSVIAAWIRKDAIEREPALAPALQRYAAALDIYPVEKAKYDVAQAEWLKSGKKGDAPRVPLGPGHHNAPGGLYNGMIAPLMPLKIKGVLWYQGEQNVWEGGAAEYRAALPALITDWRKQWGQGDLPFLIVQLPNFGPRVAEPTRSRWAELREAQASALSLPNTAMAVTIDVGEADNVHPRNKKDVGERLALAALATVYGKAIESRGPTFDRIDFDGTSATVRFDHAAGLSWKTAGTPTGFLIAGEDRRFHPAEASIGSDGVITLSSASVPRPTAVRYAWADSPDCNLVNAAGLPAQP
ncbi:MAG: sialate O-acetylesterase, partial [Sphingomonadales bacterium]